MLKYSQIGRIYVVILFHLTFQENSIETYIALLKNCLLPGNDLVHLEHGLAALEAPVLVPGRGRGRPDVAELVPAAGEVLAHVARLAVDLGVGAGHGRRDLQLVVAHGAGEALLVEHAVPETIQGVSS